MAVSTTNAVSGPYAANGVTVAFPFTFTAPSSSEIAVLTRGSEGTETTVNPSTYSVAINAAGGGTVTFDTAPASGLDVVIYLDTNFTQEIEFENGAAWLAEPVNEGYDRSALRDQVLRRDVDRGFRVPLGEAGGVLPSASSRSGMVLGFGAGGVPVAINPGGSDAALRGDLASDLSGALLVAWRAGGVGAVLRTLWARIADLPISVKDFGAVGDGVTDDAVAINAALLLGGIVDLPGELGTVYKSSTPLRLTRARTTLMGGSGVTALINGGNYDGIDQDPFPACILVTGDDCAVRGRGRGFTIQNANGSDGVGVAFLLVDGGLVDSCILDGAKSTVPAVTDDTFQAGVLVINHTDNVDAVASRVVITRNEIRNWSQYGISFYGNRVRDDRIAHNHIHDIGRAGDANSVGAGIVLTRAIRDTVIANNVIQANKGKGIFISSAGEPSSGITISGNEISGNGGYGVSITEEVLFGSVVSVGTSDVTLSGNRISGNAGGIQIGAYDGVGAVARVTSSGDLIVGNTAYGVLIQTNDDPTNRVSLVEIDSLISGNATGIGLGAKIDDTVQYKSSKIRGNTTDIDNSGDSKLYSGSLGVGAAIVSASSITLPKEGDIFSVSGSATIATILPATPGRKVSLFSSGSPTYGSGGNITNTAGNIVTAANDVVTFACLGSSWVPISVRDNS